MLVPYRDQTGLYSILLVRNRQKPCQIPLYSKAKWENVRNDLTDIYHTLTTTENYVNDMWNIFQIKLKESIKSNIPHKTAKQKDGCPWINRDLTPCCRVVFGKVFDGFLLVKY
jgi:hypothetical protein